MVSSGDEMPDSHLSAHLSLGGELPDDPELHSVVTDFVDYTEYFPSDMIRSLTLIRNLDERYADATHQVHEYALQLGKPATDAAELRRKMSKALQQATIYREAACAEANRLADSAHRNRKRLALIKRKLQALPLPPSRDPTPVPVSPQTTRSRKEEKTPKLTLHIDGGRKKLKHRRILVPGEVLPPPSASDGAYTQSEESSGDEQESVVETIERRGRKSHNIKVPKTPKQPKQKAPKPLKVRVPGQGTNVHSQVAGISTSNALALLTPPPPDAKPGSKHQPWFKLTEYEMAFLRKTMKKNAVWTPSDTMIRRYLRDHKRGVEFYEKAKAEAEAKGEEFLDEDPYDPDKPTLGPGEVAPDAPSGQAQALENRGMRLNVAKKEKAQKRKEQAEKEAAAAAEAAKAAVEAEPTKKQSPSSVSSASSSPTQKDKGAKKEMKTTRSSKKKQGLEGATQSLDFLNNDLANLFSAGPSRLQDSITITIPGSSKKEPRSSRKRKREGEKDIVIPSVESSASKESAIPPGPKKLKINHPSLAPKPSSNSQKESPTPTRTTTITTTTTIPLAPAGSSPKKTSHKREPTPGPITAPTDVKAAPVQPTAAQSRPRRVSGGVRATIEPSDEDAGALSASSKEVRATETKDREMRPRSRGSITAGKAASAEPPSKPLRELREKRRASVVDAHPASDSAAPVSGSGAATGASRTTRANRRPAPGFVTDEADGKGKVSVGKRKAAPKKGNGKDRKDEIENGEDIIDPNEPRYCICGDVSWGTMVACENAECEKEWFHLDCVDLSEPPSRRQMWYCPECREKLKVFANGDPLVVEPIRRR
ncbi:uncharacterized protein PV09_02863 [Verruconis gallopava]|uniref:PHD-type domain-containing protein n=1 Tax=Verruconis gallopava TaxID=253628 RepID=A0A0D1Z0B9_9PEZI|nr:uncharacterized protein PV09_02863 [Verruconis gallopava]KIW06412.1 hypothetical protein PV09_02863 [Verruconis gallopava]